MSNLWHGFFNTEWPEDKFVPIGWYESREAMLAELTMRADAHNYQYTVSEMGVMLNPVRSAGRSMYNMGWGEQANIYTKHKLVVFDLDDTLIEGFIQPKQPYSRVQVLPGRIATIQKYIKSGVKIGIATNQGNVGLGYNSEDDAREKFRKVYEALGLDKETTPLHFCFSDKRSDNERYNQPEDYQRRKPSGAMIREIAQHFGIEEFARVLMIGDRPEDRQAADDCGADFCDTAIFPWLTD